MQSEKLYSIIGKVSEQYSVLLKFFGYDKSVDAFISTLPFSPDQELEVLDAGSGTGFYTIAILKKFPKARVTTFDLSKSLVDRLKEKLVKLGFGSRVTLFIDNIQGPLHPLRNKKYDLIITAGVLEYVDIKRAVTNLNRFLSPGGYFLNSPVADSPLGKSIAKVYGCKPYTRETNIGAFRDSGLVLEKLLTLPPYLPASFKEAHLFFKT